MENKACYKYIEETLSFAEATDKCVELGAKILNQDSLHNPVSNFYTPIHPFAPLVIIVVTTCTPCAESWKFW